MAETKNQYKLPFHKNVKTKAESDKNVFSHRGHMKYSIDFSMKIGTKILAAADGIVKVVKDDSNEGGLAKKYRKSIKKYMNAIIIKHNNNEYSGYFHLKHKSALVKRDQKVKAGQIIGLSGNTGFTSEPHLHFMVWKNVKEKHKFETMKIRFKKVKNK